MKKIYYLCTAFLLLSVQFTFAQEQEKQECELTITVIPEVTTPHEVTVKGTAKVPENGHLWVLVQSKDWSGWYVQANGERPIDNKTGEWSAKAQLGKSATEGRGSYDIAVVVVDNDVSNGLKSWVKFAGEEGKRTNEYPTLADLPQAICSERVTVTRK